jgi:hypothetical protein
MRIRTRNKKIERKTEVEEKAAADGVGRMKEERLGGQGNLRREESYIKNNEKGGKEEETGERERRKVWR